MPEFCYVVLLRDKSNPDYELLDGIWLCRDKAEERVRLYDEEPHPTLYFAVERRILHK